jgi:hypothetical protein
MTVYLLFDDRDFMSAHAVRSYAEQEAEWRNAQTGNDYWNVLEAEVNQESTFDPITLLRRPVSKTQQTQPTTDLTKPQTTAEPTERKPGYSKEETP